MLHIKVAYALPEEAVVLSLSVSPGTNIEDAICQSGILKRFPDISLHEQRVGVYGKLAPLNDTVREGDRIEIYRPVTVDPKEARRLRAQKALLSRGAKPA